MAQPVPTQAERAIRRDGWLLTWLMKPFCKLNLPDSIDIRSDRPTIAVGNHRSFLDVFLMAAFCYSAKTSCRCFVQAAFFKNPIMGRWLRRIGCIPLNRATKEEAFAAAAEAMARGELIGVMAEGRLVPPEERTRQVGQARPGAAELAREQGAYMRPIVFHNTDKVWPRGGWPKIQRHRPTVSMVLDNTHFVPTGDAQHDIDTVMERLAEMLDELDELDGLDADGAPSNLT